MPVYEPDIGLTRLETVRVSRAAADQRRGRAGRTEPGVCYRLWEEAATGALEAFARPEILSADLAPLLLDCAAWGVSDPTRLSFLDPPPAPALKEARVLLERTRTRSTRMAASPRRAGICATSPLPPRLARMVLEAAGAGHAARRRTILRQSSSSAALAAMHSTWASESNGFAATARSAREDMRRHGRRDGPARATAASFPVEPVVGRRSADPGLSRPHCEGARQTRRVPDGEWPRRLPHFPREDIRGVDTLDLHAEGLRPNTTFAVFLTQMPVPPFGAVQYIGDFTTNAAGRGSVRVDAIINEAFAFNNITGVRTDLNHIVFWFADPADDEDCVPGSAPAHFDGDGESGVAAMSSKNFLPGAPLP